VCKPHGGGKARKGGRGSVNRVAETRRASAKSCVCWRILLSRRHDTHKKRTLRIVETRQTVATNAPTVTAKNRSRHLLCRSTRKGGKPEKKGEPSSLKLERKRTPFPEPRQSPPTKAEMKRVQNSESKDQATPLPAVDLVNQAHGPPSGSPETPPFHHETAGKSQVGKISVHRGVTKVTEKHTRRRVTNKKKGGRGNTGAPRNRDVVGLARAVSVRTAARHYWRTTAVGGAEKTWVHKKTKDTRNDTAAGRWGAVPGLTWKIRAERERKLAKTNLSRVSSEKATT